MQNKVRRINAKFLLDRWPDPVWVIRAESMSVKPPLVEKLGIPVIAAPIDAYRWFLFKKAEHAKMVLAKWPKDAHLEHTINTREWLKRVAEGDPARAFE